GPNRRVPLLCEGIWGPDRAILAPGTAPPVHLVRLALVPVLGASRGLLFLLARLQLRALRGLVPLHGGRGHYLDVSLTRAARLPGPFAPPVAHCVSGCSRWLLRNGITCRLVVLVLESGLYRTTEALPQVPASLLCVHGKYSMT